MKKKCLAFLLAAVLCLGLLPAAAFAANSDFTIENGVLTAYNGPGGDVVIPNGVTSIGERAFFDHKGVTSVTIPFGVTSIGDFAFSFCEGLVSVAIPSSVTSIGDCSFNYCTSLTSVTIPSGVTSIGESAFADCAGLTSVIIPSSMNSIGDHAFSKCGSLASVTFPNSVASLSIGYHAFEECKSLTSIILPRGSTSIGMSAFSLCDGLTSVVIQDGLTEIGDSAFMGCEKLTSVTIPNSVTSIGGMAFCYCTSLTGVNIPESVTSIGAQAFDQCTALTEIAIPSGVTRIEGRTFNNCTNLTRVVIPDGLTDIHMYAFEKCPNVTVVRANGQTVDGAKIELPPVRNTYYQNLSSGAVYNLEVGDVLNLTNTQTDSSLKFSTYGFSFGGNQGWTVYAPNTNGSTVQITAIDPGTVTVSGTLTGSVPKTNYGKQYNIATKKWESYTYITHEQQTLTTTATIVVTGSGQPAPSQQPTPSQPAPSFTDLKPNAFYLEPVAWAVVQGITTGTTATTFSPDQTCNHAQILTFLWRAAGSPASDAVTPIAMKGDEYYYGAVKWAAGKGMVGADFKPNTSCTRADAVSYIWQAFGKPAPTKASPFTDIPAHWSSASAAAWAAEKGITTGTTATTFAPDQICNRGQIVTFLYRAYK